MNSQKNKLDDYDKKIIQKALKIINQQYNKNVNLKDNLISIIDELIETINSKNDEIEALEFDIQENYRPIPNSNLEYPYY